MLDRFFVSLFEGLTILGCFVGGAMVLYAMMPDSSAPQEAALAAVGIGLAVIPYCLASIAHRGIVRKSMAKRDAEI